MAPRVVFRPGSWRAGTARSILAVALASVVEALFASNYEAAIYTGQHTQQITESPTPVALTNSEGFNNGTLGSGEGAAIAAGGPGLANGVAAVVMFTNPDLAGRTQLGAQTGAFASYDGIVITGPPGTPPGTAVTYSVNLFVTSEMQASHGGPGSPYSRADSRVRFGTSSSFGFYGGIELGHIRTQGDGVYEATGIFSSVASNQTDHALVGGSPTWRARTGDSISVALQVEGSAGVGDDRSDYGPGGAHMMAKASMQVTFLGQSVFNFAEPGWNANSADGTIVNNQFILPEAPHGDFNRDHLVDAADYVVWRKSLGTLVDRNSGADGNGNGFVEQDDYNNWRVHFGDSTMDSGQQAPVPEPAAVSLLMCAVLGWFVRRQRAS